MAPAEGDGDVLRANGAPPLCSKLREPRLPKLDPLLWNELPARASARLGASANVRQNSTGRRVRHRKSRLDMGLSLRDRRKGAFRASI
jgi:hypothetical protein